MKKYIKHIKIYEYYYSCLSLFNHHYYYTTVRLQCTGSLHKLSPQHLSKLRNAVQHEGRKNESSLNIFLPHIHTKEDLARFSICSILKSTYGRALELLNITTEATFPITLYFMLENFLLIKSLISVFSLSRRSCRSMNVP